MPDQFELFPKRGDAEPIDAPETESVEGPRWNKKKKNTDSDERQKEIFPEVAEDARRLKKFKPGPAREALKKWLTVEKKILNRKKEEQKARLAELRKKALS